MNTDFTTIQGYREFRKEWKISYKELSQKIRDTKKQRKYFKWEYRSKDDTISKRRKKIGLNPNFDCDATYRVQVLKYQARTMMKTLDDAKARLEIILLSDDRKAA